MPRIYTTLSLYIGRHFLIALMGTLLVIMGLILLLDYIELLRRAGGAADAGMLVLLKMALFKLPQMIQQVLPFAVLIGGMVAMWRLTRSHELVVMRSVGVSIWQFLGPAMVVVIAIGVINVTVINPLSAKLYEIYESMEDTLILNQTGAFDISAGGMWLREPAGDGGQVVVHANEVRQDGRELAMRGLAFMYLDENERFLKRIDASVGRLANGKFLLRSVYIMEPGQPTVEKPAMTLPTSLTIGRVQENFASPETLSFWELPQFIAFFESAGFSAQRHRMYLHSLIASPFLLCAMTLMAAVFSTSPNQRSGKGLLRVVGAVGAGFLLYFFSKLTVALGLSSTLPLWLSAWTPTLVTFMLGTATLLHLEDG